MISKKVTKIMAALLLTLSPLFLGSDTIYAATNVNYTVQSGDTLWKISQKFNTSINSIVTLNSITNPNLIYVGQTLLVQDNISKNISTINYKVVYGDNLWSIASKYNTSMDAIAKTNMLSSYTIMPGQILTVPVNSTEIAAPVGIQMYKPRLSNSYGDIYTWENGRRLFTVDTIGTLKDLQTGIYFNIKYYGGSNHADIVPITKTDTTKIVQIFPNWSWSSQRPMILFFSQGGKQYQIAVSMTGMPHSTTNIYDNGISGHFDLYFYNSTSHVSNEISPTHQQNVLIANGQK